MYAIRSYYDARDVIAIIGADADTVTEINAQVNADKRLVLCTPGVQAYDTAADQTVTLPGNYTAAAVAGLIASLAPQASPTNKTLPVITSYSIHYTKLYDGAIEYGSALDN